MTPAEKLKLVDEVEAQLEPEIQRRAEALAEIMVASMMAGKITVDLIERTNGGLQCRWLGVPVTREQFEMMLKNSRSDGRLSG